MAQHDKCRVLFSQKSRHLTGQEISQKFEPIGYRTKNLCYQKRQLSNEDTTVAKLTDPIGTAVKKISILIQNKLQVQYSTVQPQNYK